MMDAALEALAKRHREAEIDAAYAAYDRLPLSAPDEWGDVESFATANSLGSLQQDASDDSPAES